MLRAWMLRCITINGHSIYLTNVFTLGMHGIIFHIYTTNKDEVVVLTICK